MKLARYSWLLLAMASPAWSFGWRDFMPGPHHPPAGQALLRCDPGLMIMSIDGDKSRRVNNARGNFDCAVLLEPGRHTMGLRVEVTYSENIFTVTEGITDNDDFSLEVAADRIYRIKYTFGKRNSYHLEDVTDEEGPLRFHDYVGRSANRKLPEAERMSYVVARILPTGMLWTVHHGSTHGIWFLSHRRQVYRVEKGSDFVVEQVPAGTNLATTFAAYAGDAWGPGVFRAHVCGETPFRMFEDLPGGKVLFLGTYRYRPIPRGLELTFDQKDLEAAKTHLRERHPELADKLEPATFRPARHRSVCRSEFDGELINAAFP